MQTLFLLVFGSAGVFLIVRRRDIARLMLLLQEGKVKELKFPPPALPVDGKKLRLYEYELIFMGVLVIVGALLGFYSRLAGLEKWN